MKLLPGILPMINNSVKYEVNVALISLKQRYYYVVMILFACMLGCQKPQEKVYSINEYGLPNCPGYCTPKVYAVHTLSGTPTIDGYISDDEWGNTPWSEPLVSSVKNGMANPAYSTRYKLGTKGDSLYFSAIVYDRHIWAVNDICQSYFFEDNFLELYLDADNDEKDYVVLKINALGNLCGEYWNRNNDKPLSRFSLLDMSHGRCSVFIDGTVNNPKDNDRYWSFECAVPLNLQVDSLTLLQPHTTWNVNVQRTYWPSVVVAGLYKKMLNPHTGKKYPGEKWVWSFLDENNINTPELWGEWHFNTLNQTSQEISRQQFERQVRWELRNIYYAQQRHLKRYGRFSRKVAGLTDVGLKLPKLLYKPNINTGSEVYEAHIYDAATGTKFTINHEGKVWKEQQQ
ncbi:MULTISPECIES: carbohydrate-binding family 9-like protein [unclassified Saccharicrinis]|uniref:carbohydrate-binding family 9-like protein n=1 Tax=unclassified Saccharicrinis TaxID=2646859 RepID=UPI003D340AC3